MTNLPPGSPSDEVPEIVVSYGAVPDAAASETLAALRHAVAMALDRKRRLGQYAVFWEDGHVVRVEGKDLPGLPT